MAENPRLWKGFLPGCWTTSLVSVSVPTPTREDRGGRLGSAHLYTSAGVHPGHLGHSQKEACEGQGCPRARPDAPCPPCGDCRRWTSGIFCKRLQAGHASQELECLFCLRVRPSQVTRSTPNLRTGGPRCPSDTRDKATKYNRHHPPGLLRGWSGGGGEGAGAVTSALGGWYPGHRQGGPFLGFPQVMPGYERALSLPLGLAREQAGRLPLQSRASGSLF